MENQNQERSPDLPDPKKSLISIVIVTLLLLGAFVAAVYLRKFFV